MTTLDRNQSALRFDTITSVTAGQNLYVVSPEDARLQITSVSFRLVTDANAANRRVTVQASDGSNFFGTTPAPGNQIASETCDYHFALCILGIDQLTDFNTMWAPLSQDLFLDEFTHFETNILGIQVGDVISNVIIRYAHAFRVKRSRRLR